MDRLIRKFSRHLLAWLRRSRSGRICFVKRLSYSDIKRATDNFQRVIYRNSQIAAYKAKFEDGGLYLVKEVRDFDVPKKDIFSREVQLLGRLHHRHILSLKGFSIGQKRLLVFDNIQNGSLKEHLNDPLKTPLDWRTRFQIALGVVAALEYLFLFIEPPMYQVSISSSTIMLDENLNAKLSEVGHLSSGCGKCAMKTQSKADCTSQERNIIVFQLGVTLLELITGQSSDTRSSELIQWIQEGSSFHHSMHMMIDPDLGNSFDSMELKNLLAVAKLCITFRDKPVLSVPQLFQYLHKKMGDLHN